MLANKKPDEKQKWHEKGLEEFLPNIIMKHARKHHLTPLVLSVAGE